GAVGVLRRRCRRVAVEVRLEDVDGTGSLPAGHGVDQDRRGRVVEDRKGEVEPTNAEIDDADALCVLPGREQACNLDAESVVAQEDVADSRDQDGALAHGCSSTGSTRSRSSRPKQKRCPGCRSAPRSLPGSSSTSTAM